MARAMREAVQATRDLDDGIVSTKNGKVYVKFTEDAPIVVENLIRKSNWLIKPQSAYEKNLTLFKSR